MTLPSEKSATDVAAQCFLNALIRETKDWQLTEYPPDELIIPLDEQKSLHFRVVYFSPTQHHRFAFPARLVTASGSYPVDFTTLSRLIIDKLRHQLFLPVPLCETFHQRVLESYAHTQQAIDARRDWAILREKALNFGEAEQALLTGHAFHPAPKSHEPFNQQEAERYLPDMAPHFPLRWFLVDKTQIAGESLNLNLQQRLTRFAAENAPQLLNELSDNQWLFPQHPWQGEYLLQQGWCQALVDNGLIRDLGEAGTLWLPTTSSRSLYCATSRDMIKFSLSVRLTNSVRTLSVKEVKRGMRLARLAQTDGWQMLQASFPTFRVMQEDGWAGLRDLNGNIMQESLDPRVEYFWEQSGSLEVQTAYLERQLTDKHAFPLIGCFDDRPFSYFEIYWAAEDRIGRHYSWQPFDRGLHLLVGEQQWRGAHYVQSWLRGLTHYLLLDEPRTQRTVLEPRTDNQRLFRHLEPAGYRTVKEFDFPHKRSRMAMTDRQHFFTEIGL